MIVLTTGRLLCAGLWESNERYLFVFVTLQYTFTSPRPSGSTVVLVSKKEIVGLPVDFIQKCAKSCVKPD